MFLLTLDYSWSLIIWSIIGCLIGRLFVYPFAFALNRVSKSQPLTVNEMHTVWFAGLRGAVAFVCVLRFPENEVSQNRNVFMCTAMVIVFLSIVWVGQPQPS